MKKLLPTIGLYLGTFIVLNVAMFFLLKLTQPAPAPSELALGQDSTAHDSAHVELTDSLVADPHSGEHTAEVESMHGDSTTPDSAAAHSTAKMDTTAHQANAEMNPAQHETANVEQHSEEPVAEATIEAAGSDSATTEEASSETKSGEEIAKLAKVLEGMKPAEAAVIAERLPTDTIVELVMRMKARTGAKMMASLPVPVAANVASRMAELSGAKKSS